MDKVATILSGWKNVFFPESESVEEEGRRRAAICAKCPHYMETKLKLSVCGKCSCPLAAKTRAKDSACPDGRW